MTDKECWKECEYANPKSEIIRAYLMKKQENKQLKAQIEKMKCCVNCKKYRMLESQMTLKCLKNQRTNFCCNEWEMKD